VFLLFIDQAGCVCACVCACNNLNGVYSIGATSCIPVQEKRKSRQQSGFLLMDSITLPRRHKMQEQRQSGMNLSSVHQDQPSSICS